MCKSRSVCSLMDEMYERDKGYIASIDLYIAPYHCDLGTGCVAQGIDGNVVTARETDAVAASDRTASDMSRK